MRWTKYYIQNEYIYGPEMSGRFYIQDGYIYGPRNGGKYYIQNVYIYGPTSSGRFYIQDNYIYGPSDEELPWLSQTGCTSEVLPSQSYSENKSVSKEVRCVTM